MITAGDFRNGMDIRGRRQCNADHRVQHVKPGKGAAFVRTKVRNVITGSVVEKTYNPPPSSPPLTLRERIWNTPTPTASSITSWFRDLRGYPRKRFRVGRQLQVR